MTMFFALNLLHLNISVIARFLFSVLVVVIRVATQSNFTMAL